MPWAVAAAQHNPFLRSDVTRGLKTATIVLAAGAAAIATGAAADVTGIYTTGDSGKLTVYYQDGGNVRMQMSDDSYVLVRGSGIYMVGRDGGDWQVIDLSQVRRQMDQMGLGGILDSALQQNQPQAAFEAEYELKDTGRSETVAGIGGTVYQVTYKDADSGKVTTEEAVLTDDERVQAAQRAMLKVSQQMANTMFGKQFESFFAEMEMGPAKDLGLLRSGQDLVLASIEDGAIDDKIFELPAAPESMDGLGAAINGAPNGAPVEAGGENVVVQDAQEIGGNAVDEAHQSIKEGIDGGIQDKVREGAGKLLKGLFGG